MRCRRTTKGRESRLLRLRRSGSTCPTPRRGIRICITRTSMVIGPTTHSGLQIPAFGGFAQVGKLMSHNTAKQSGLFFVGAYCCSSGLVHVTLLLVFLSLHLNCVYRIRLALASHVALYSRPTQPNPIRLVSLRSDPSHHDTDPDRTFSPSPLLPYHPPTTQNRDRASCTTPY